MATTSETRPAIQARIFRPPSMMKSTASGMMAHSALIVSESPTALGSCWNIENSQGGGWMG